MPFIQGIFEITKNDISNDNLKDSQADQTEALALLLGVLNESYYGNTFLSENEELSEFTREKIYSNKVEKLKAYFIYSISELYSIDEVNPENEEEYENVPYIAFPVNGHTYKHFPNYDTTAIKFLSSNGEEIIYSVYSNPNSTRIRILNSDFRCIFDLFDYEIHGDKTSDYFDIYSIQDYFQNDFKLLDSLNSKDMVHFIKKIESFTPDLYTAKSFILDDEIFYIVLNCKCSYDSTYKDRVINRIETSIDLILFDKTRLFFSIIAIFILLYTIVFPILRLSKNASEITDQNGRIGIINLYGDKRKDEIGVLSRSFENLISRLNSRIEETEIMTSDLSHEMKNPLAVIRMLTEAINSYEISSEEKKELCIKLLNETKRIELIIGNIRLASKIENKSYENTREAIDCDLYLSNIISHYSSNNSSKKINGNLNAKNKKILINPELLDIVFDNLISNGFSFANEMLISSDVEKSNIVISVEDNGPGVPANEREKIFKRFYSNRKNIDEITHDGLGLHLVKYIINSIGGSIKVEESKNLKGACFVILIPDI